ncbi:uromodulin-like [Huso huso]|uniref:Uromodulin-like n=1 Tax=Huso huso TaxID=61971 RepID=A0ABR0Y232_HUSHU
MPEKCVPDYSCGSDATLWITGTHPVETDGIVSRKACAGWQLNCCHSSITVHIKACPGNYHVYKYQGVPWCFHVYCAEYNPTITALQTVPLSCFNQPCLSGQDCITDSCVDPCQQYNVLDEPWRSTHFPVSSSSDPKCDRDLNGWYRFLVNESVRMPEACVPEYSCGTHAPMWINGTHPLETDGIVSRQSCGKWSSSCCYFTTTVHIKACPGNYHVYKFQGTPGCNLAYCAERSTETTERPTETTERSTETTERSTETTERSTETQTSPESERLPKGMTLRWRKKDGKIFHKQEEEEEEEEKETETCSKP